MVGSSAICYLHNLLYAYLQPLTVISLLCRLLANLYSGNVYIWNTNDQVNR